MVRWKARGIGAGFSSGTTTRAREQTAGGQMKSAPQGLPFVPCRLKEFCSLIPPSRSSSSSSSSTFNPPPSSTQSKVRGIFLFDCTLVFLFKFQHFYFIRRAPGTLSVWFASIYLRRARALIKFHLASLRVIKPESDWVIESLYKRERESWVWRVDLKYLLIKRGTE